LYKKVDERIIKKASPVYGGNNKNAIGSIIPTHHNEIALTDPKGATRCGMLIEQIIGWRKKDQ